MLHPFANVLAWYGAGGFAIALLCALPYFDRPATLDGPWARRMLRRAQLLALAGPLHPVIALTAVGITRDVDRLSEDRTSVDRGWRRASILAALSLALSTGIAALLFLRTA